MKFVNWLRRRPVWFWITAWVAWVVIAAIGISICGWDWLNEDESNSATIRNIILAAAALIALPLAIWRGTAAHRQTETAQRQFEIAQRGLLNERYQKGAAMLGSDILSVRLGGIYALSRLSHEHPKEYHTQIMDLLCAFVRFPPTGEEKTDEADCEGQYPRLRQDVQEIMTVIGKRDTEKIEIEKNDGHSLDLFGAHLTGARLVNANLSGVNLSLTNLIGADLSGANLARTHLYCAKMSGAFLSDAFLKKRGSIRRGSVRSTTVLRTSVARESVWHELKCL